jgi:hypothetical protein
MARIAFGKRKVHIAKDILVVSPSPYLVTPHDNCLYAIFTQNPSGVLRDGFCLVDILADKGVNLCRALQKMLVRLDSVTSGRGEEADDALSNVQQISSERERRHIIQSDRIMAHLFQNLLQGVVLKYAAVVGI